MQRIIEVLQGFNACSITFRILLATVVGGCIGSERGRHGQAAGLRTHILVCVGAAMTTLIGLYAANHLSSIGDPMRMGAQVISGMGFLGAGTIMVRNRSHVTGLTTAAGLWTTACIGLAIGAGFYAAAIPAFLVVMATITVFIHLERASKPRNRDSYYVEMKDLLSARRLYEEVASCVSAVELVPPKSGLAEHVGLEVSVNSTENNKRLQKKLDACENVEIVVPIQG